MKKCIIFDIDRTIVDSYKSELLSLKKAIENVTNKDINDDDIKKLTSLTTSDFFNYLNFTSDEVSLVNKEWEKTYSNFKIDCFPKIKDVIKSLYNDGYYLAIITSRTMEEFHELDECLYDILNCFAEVITSDKVERPKPNPDCMNILCDKLKLNKNEVLYIGDSETDKIFAQNLGVDFIPACWENKELENEDNACSYVEDLIDKIDSYR